MLKNLVWLILSISEDKRETLEMRVCQLPPFPGLKKFHPGWIDHLIKHNFYAKEIDELKSGILFCLYEKFISFFKSFSSVHYIIYFFKKKRKDIVSDSHLLCLRLNVQLTTWFYRRKWNETLLSEWYQMIKNFKRRFKKLFKNAQKGF
jgi:hypothetical protein